MTTPSDITADFAAQVNVLDGEIRKLDRQIADAEESLERHGWPEIATELSYLEGQRAELEVRRDDLLHGWQLLGTK